MISQLNLHNLNLMPIRDGLMICVGVVNIIGVVDSTRTINRAHIPTGQTAS